MATIEYKFSDGHIEEIEVTEEFKAAYEFELAREKARYWKAVLFFRFLNGFFRLESARKQAKVLKNSIFSLPKIKISKKILTTARLNGSTDTYKG